jgi:hypothetical protein
MASGILGTKRGLAMARLVSGASVLLKHWKAADVAVHEAGNVTGFGCRPSTDTSTRTTGPAFESRQGRKARDWGTRLSGRYGDLVGADGCNERLSR